MTLPGVILAGGQGLRIGGAKASRILAGRPLWTHVADRIRPQVATLAYNADHGVGDLPALPDHQPGQGPLGGILAAMHWAQGQGAERVLTVSVDTPFLPVDLVDRLAGEDAAIAMAETADGLHGTCAIWDVALAPALADALDAGHRKVTDFSMAYGAAPVRFADASPPPFFNINTQADLDRAEAWLA